MRFGMAIDISTCMGCHTCSVACKMSNNLPNEVWWTNVKTDGGEGMDTARGEYPGSLYRYYHPVSCQHCSKPACVEVCPTGASYVNEENGLVNITTEECIGCGSCITACPYNVRTLYDSELLYSVDFTVGEIDSPAHVEGTVGKCTGCANRLERDLAPACMNLCPGRARYWGDLDDPESDVSTFIKGKEYEKLLEASGTEPNVFYVKSMG